MSYDANDEKTDPSIAIGELTQSVVTYLEKEDPKRPFREKVACSVNVGDFELRFRPTADNEQDRRTMWDSAVSTLMQILGEVGLSAKYIHNDKNSCRLVLRQDEVQSADLIPDEYFAIELFYCSEFELERRKLQYVRQIHKFEEDITAKRTVLRSWKTPKHKYKEILTEIDSMKKDKDFFIATTPDPREMDSGLILKIDLITLKEYQVVKQKLRTILSRYISAISHFSNTSAATHGELKAVA